MATSTLDRLVLHRIEIILCLILSIQLGSRLLLAHTLCDSFWNNIENIQKEVFTSNGHHWYLDYRKPKLVYFKVFWRYGPQGSKNIFICKSYLNCNSKNCFWAHICWTKDNQIWPFPQWKLFFTNWTKLLAQKPRDI